MTEGNRNPRTVAHMSGMVLIVASLLWVAFCGTCAFQFLNLMLPRGASTGDLAFGLLVTFVPAALGAALGYSLFVVGLNLWKAR
ncbi:MAG: hypothetical protein ABL996_26565 [Micropepsaceae bacterium]